MEASQELGVSPRRVRQFLEQGVLPGQRIGGRWIVADHALEIFGTQERSAGRPWSSAAAWAVLAELAELNLDISPVQRSRARQRLRNNTLVEVVPQLRRRAKAMSYYAHPSALERIRLEEPVVLGGVSAAPHVKADLIDPNDHLEAYIRERDLEGLVRRFALNADAERPNVVLRVVTTELWPFAPDTRFCPPVVVALDLIETSDSRSRRAGFDLLQRR